jgi:hypothetical protein
MQCLGPGPRPLLAQRGAPSEALPAGEGGSGRGKGAGARSCNEHWCKEEVTMGAACLSN